MRKRTKIFLGIGVIAIILISWFLPDFLSKYNINYQTISLKVILFSVILLLTLTIFFMYIFFKNRNFNEYYDNLQKVFAILTIVIAIIEVIILSNQTSILSTQTWIQDTQNQILKQTSQSNFPDLYIVSSQGYKAYSIEDIKKYPRIGIGITNTGKATAPFVRVEFISGIFRGWDEVTEDDFVIRDLESFEYNTTWFRFEKSDTILTSGKFDISFSINCAFSQTPIKIQNITICIYSSYDKIIEECGEEWK